MRAGSLHHPHQQAQSTSRLLPRRHRLPATPRTNPSTRQHCASALRGPCKRSELLMPAKRPAAARLLCLLVPAPAGWVRQRRMPTFGASSARAHQWGDQQQQQRRLQRRPIKMLCSEARRGQGRATRCLGGRERRATSGRLQASRPRRRSTLRGVLHHRTQHSLHSHSDPHTSLSSPSFPSSPSPSSYRNAKALSPLPRARVRGYEVMKRRVCVR